ncbi:MAG: hypothetical protein FD121_1196 [Gallionellaceae bacterium]|nr:MAG: hypothetical protein FD121_1196 [Gallionellaceae bacterium]
MHPIIQTWLFQSAVIFLVIGSVAGLFVGALLIFRPQHFQVISVLLNRWISTRTFDKNLERSFSLDPWLYRYQRFTGMLILLGSLFVLFYFTVQLDRAATIEGLAKHFHYYPSIVGGLLDALVLSSLLGTLCAVFVALSLIFRPSLLRGFEESANQWLSLRKALKPLEIPRDNMERYVQRHTRQIGIFLLLGSLYTLVLLAYGMARIN